MEFFAITGVQFLTLRLVATWLGVAQLGIWSVLIASVQVAKLLDPGLAAGSVRFIVKANETQDKAAIAEIISTTVLVTSLAFAAALALAYYPLCHFVVYALPNNSAEAGRLLPYAMASYYTQTVSGAVLASLINIGKSPVKSILSSVGTLLQLVLSVVLIKRNGLTGLALAQIANNAFCGVVATVYLIVFVRVPFARLLRPNLRSLASMTRTGATLQLNSLAWSSFDILGRLMMSRFGGVEMAGYSEVANRSAAQMRLLMGYVNQSVLPEYFVRRLSGNLQEFYAVVYARFATAGLFLFACSLLVVPILYQFIFGEINRVFLAFTALAAAGGYVHILAMPSESVAAALGSAGYNLIGNLAKLLILAAVAALSLGRMSAIGVAGAVFVSIVVGVAVTICFNSQRFGLLLLPRLPGFKVMFAWGGASLADAIGPADD